LERDRTLSRPRAPPPPGLYFSWSSLRVVVLFWALFNNHWITTEFNGVNCGRSMFNRLFMLSPGYSIIMESNSMFLQGWTTRFAQNSR
jgi:hypothetical protein